MPRGARTLDVLPEFPHHVTLRGNNRRTLFSRAPDYQRFVALIADAKAKNPIDLHAAVLMTNHVHLVLTTPDVESLSRFVGSAAQRYSQIRNAQKSASGKLWEGRYFAKPIETEAQLAATLAYVELNPVRAGLCADPSDYRWSTFACHAGGKGGIPAALWTPAPWYLELADTPDDRQRRYVEFMDAYRASDLRPEQFDALDAKEALIRLTSGVRIRRPGTAS